MLPESAAWVWLHQLPQWAPQPAAQVQVGQHCDALCSVVIQLLLHHPRLLHQNCCPERWCHHCYFHQAEYLVPLYGTSPLRSKGTLSCAGHVSVKVFPLAPVQEHISGNSHSPSSTCKETEQIKSVSLLQTHEAFLTLRIWGTTQQLWLKAFTATWCNKIFSGYQPHQDTWKAWRFGNYLCPYHQVLFKYPDAADSPRRFYYNTTTVAQCKVPCNKDAPLWKQYAGYGLYHMSRKNISHYHSSYVRWPQKCIYVSENTFVVMKHIFHWYTEVCSCGP